MTHALITLRVPYDPREHDHPAKWDWTALADSVEPITVVATDIEGDNPAEPGGAPDHA